MQFFGKKIIKDGARPSRIVIAIIYTVLVAGVLAWGAFIQKEPFEGENQADSSQISK